MSLRPHLPIGQALIDLSHLDRAAEDAPEGTFEQAKALAEFFSELHTFMRQGLSAYPLCLKVSNTDPYREVEAAIYAMIKDANPGETMFGLAEGFGEHVQGPARERVIANTIRDRDFLRSKGLI